MRLLVILAVLAGSAGVAEAYPQFQLSTGNVRCNQCHFAPAGGGLLREWGREEAADTISGGGNGAFLHGAWTPPDWLELGGDLRGVAMFNDVGGTEAGRLSAFPMQAELYVLFNVADAWKINMHISSGLGPLENAASPVVSRDHWIMWQPKEQGSYLRAGRFLAPHGLRMVEHPTFVRRFMGLGAWEETYNLSAGYVKNDWEFHATLFTPDTLIVPVGWRGRGVTALYERRAGEENNLSYGVQTKLGWSGEDDRYSIGGTGKYWLEGPELLLWGELNLVYQTFDDVDSAARGQAVSFLGVTWFPGTGYMLQAAWEHHDEDMAVRAVSRDAATVQAHWFPTAHLEVLLYGRVQLLAGGQGGDTASLGMLQLHYYL